MASTEEIVKRVNSFWFKYRYDNGYTLTGSLTHIGEKDMLVKFYEHCQPDTVNLKPDMTSKEYYNSTRLVETRQWTLEMALAFAEEYHKSQIINTQIA